jgi:hypothetical protein
MKSMECELVNNRNVQQTINATNTFIKANSGGAVNRHLIKESVQVY